MTTFATKLKPLVQRIGTAEAARICGVTTRTLQRWMRGPDEPCAAMQAGVLLLLSRVPAQ